MAQLTVKPGPPKTAEELLWVCRQEIASGNLETARRLATRFAEATGSGSGLDPALRFQRLAYAWYVLTMAAYTVCQSKPEGEVYEYLVVFFRAHKSASWYFLKYLQSFDHGLRTQIRDSVVRDELDALYDGIYSTWGAGLAGRADLAANREVSL